MRGARAPLRAPEPEHAFAGGGGPRGSRAGGRQARAGRLAGPFGRELAAVPLGYLVKPAGVVDAALLVGPAIRLLGGGRTRQDRDDDKEREPEASSSHRRLSSPRSRPGQELKNTVPQRATSGSPTRAHHGSATARMATHPTSVIQSPKRRISPAETWPRS